MAQQNAGWNLFSWWKKREGKQADRRRALALETLEGRVVPATVVNPFDSTNPSFPVPGSLRWAIANAEPGETIDFAISHSIMDQLKSSDPEAYARFYNPITQQYTITLNGAVGSLRVADYNISIQDNIDSKTELPTNKVGNPEIKVTADKGIATLRNENILNEDGTIVLGKNILKSGLGYRVGDQIQQGIETKSFTDAKNNKIDYAFLGGALFQVTKVGLQGEVLELAVVNPGANGNWADPEQTSPDALDRIILSSTDPNNPLLPVTGQKSINPLRSGSGSGLQIGNLRQSNFGYTSDLFLVDPQQTNLNDGTSFSKFTLQNIELADARSTGVQVNLGSLQVDYCVFKASDDNHEQDTFINTTRFSTGLSINQSSFDSAFRYEQAIPENYELDDPYEGLMQREQGFTKVIPQTDDLEIDSSNFTWGGNGLGSVILSNSNLEIQKGQLIRIKDPSEENSQYALVNFYNPLNTGAADGVQARELVFKKLWTDGVGATPDSTWTVELVSNIKAAGSGYTVGDLLEQESTDLTGGRALFRVTQVGDIGEIEGLEVVVGGNQEELQRLLVVSNQDESEKRVLKASNESFFKLINKTGEGKDAKLGMFVDANFGLNYFRMVTNPSVQVNYAGAGLVNIRNSTFSESITALQAASGSFTLDTSLTISDTSFRQGRVVSEATKSAITRSYFIQAVDGALELGNSATTITDSYFNDNVRSSGIQINATSLTGYKSTPLGDTDVPLYGIGASDLNNDLVATTNWIKAQYNFRFPLYVKPNPNRGGGAIYAWEGRRLSFNPANSNTPDLNIQKTVFSNNSAEGINTFNAGGGAIYSNGGNAKLNLTQTGFTNNRAWITAYPSLDGSDTEDFATNPENMPSAANSGGGAVYAGGPLTILNSYFNDNTLESSVDYWAPTAGTNSGTPQYTGGGALYLTSNNSASVNSKLENTTLSGNTVIQTPDTEGLDVINPYVGANVTNVVARMPDLEGSPLDFNRDGIPDLAVGSNALNNNIDVRLGTVDTNPGSNNIFNNFSTVKYWLSTGASVIRDGLRTGDFDGDGLPDLAAIRHIGSNKFTMVDIFYNAGFETSENGIIDPNSWKGFQAPITFSTGYNNGIQLLSGDLNQDGLDDLVVLYKERGDRTTFNPPLDNNPSFATATAARQRDGSINFTFFGRASNYTDPNLNDLIDNVYLNCGTLAWINGDTYPDLVLGYDAYDGMPDDYTWNMQVVLNSALPAVNQTRVWSELVYTYNAYEPNLGDPDDGSNIFSVVGSDFRGDNDLYQDIAAASRDDIFVDVNLGVWTNSAVWTPRFRLGWAGTDNDITFDNIQELAAVDLDDDQIDDLILSQDSDSPFGYSLSQGDGNMAGFFFYDFNSRQRPQIDTQKGGSLTGFLTYVGGEPRYNVVVGQELTGNIYATDPEAGNIWIGYNKLPDGIEYNDQKAINFYYKTDLNPVNISESEQVNYPNASKFQVRSRGLGLNGGALIASAGVDDSLPNNVSVRDFNGTTNLTITNSTVAQNRLENLYIVSELDATSAAGGQNLADTGGLFSNVGGGSLQIQNALLHQNSGILFNKKYNKIFNIYEYPTLTGLSNISSGPGTVTIASLGNNLINNNRAPIALNTGDITTEPTAPVFFFGGIGNYQGPIIGLNPFAEIGSSNTTYSIPVPFAPGTRASFAVRGFTNQDLKDGDLVRLAVDSPAGQTEAYVQGRVSGIPPFPPLVRPTSITLTLESAVGWGTHRNWIVYKEQGPPDTGALSPQELLGTSDTSITLPLPPGIRTFTCQDIPENSLDFGDTVRLEAVDLPGAFVEGQLTATPNVISGITTLRVNILSQSGTGTVNLWTVYKIPKPANLGQANILTLPLDRLSPARDTGSNSVYPTPLATDARGIPRKLNIAVDMGAYEVQAGTKISATPPAENIFTGTPDKIAIEVRFDDTLGYSDPGELLEGTVSLLNPHFPGKVYAIAQLNALRGFGNADLMVNQPGMEKLPPGEYDYIVVYNGNLNYAISQTNPFRLTVLNGQNVNLGLSVNPRGPVNYGTPVNLTATLSDNGTNPITGGTVQFYAMVADGKGGTTKSFLSPPLDVMNGTVAQTTFTLQLPTLPGSTSQVGVDYSGFNNYLPESTSQNYVVSKGLTTTVVTVNGNRTDRSPQTVTIQVLANPTFVFPPTGQVRLLINGIPYGTPLGLNGGEAKVVYTPNLPGSYSFEAQYLGDSSYNSSSGSASVTINRATVEDFVLTAPQAGNTIQIQRRKIDPDTGAIQISQEMALQPLGSGYNGGFTLAQGDVTGDGVEDILYAPRTGGFVNVVDGYTLQPVGSFYPFGGPQHFPLSVAVGDLNADGRGDIIVSPAGIGLPPHVVIFSPDQIGQLNPQAMASFYAYSPLFKGGVSVAAGEVEGGGGQEVITAPLAGAAPHIAVFQYAQANQNVPPSFQVIQSYYAYSPLYMGGTAITAGDLNGDGYVEIITAASAAAPHVVVVDSHTQAVKASFYAGYGNSYGGGVRVTTLDYNRDGKKDIVTSAGPGRAPELFVYDGTLAFEGQVLDPAFLADSFFAFGPGMPGTNYLGGVLVG